MPKILEVMLCFSFSPIHSRDTHIFISWMCGVCEIFRIVRNGKQTAGADGAINNIRPGRTRAVETRKLTKGPYDNKKRRAKSWWISGWVEQRWTIRSHLVQCITGNGCGGHMSATVRKYVAQCGTGHETWNDDTNNGMGRKRGRGGGGHTVPLAKQRITTVPRVKGQLTSTRWFSKAN